MAGSAHPGVTWPFFQVARRLGLPVDAGLEVIGFESDRPAAEARIDLELANQLLTWAVELSARPDIGLLAAQEVEPGHFDLVELASRSQQTVGEGLAMLDSLLPILHDGLRIALVRDEQTSELHVHLDDAMPLHPAGYDFIAASLLIAARRQTGLGVLGLRRLSFPYPRPADASYIEGFFDCDVAFDADALQFRFPTEALARPLLRGDAQAGRLLGEAARGLLTPGPAGPDPVPGHGDRVARLLRERLGKEELTLGVVARSLGVSERTLRRRLEDEGTTFRAVVDSVRHELAIDALADDTRSTDEVAQALGFTTAQALHRAFRRWTGQTVQAFRAAKRPPAKR